MNEDPPATKPDEHAKVKLADDELTHFIMELPINSTVGVGKVSVHASEPLLIYVLYSAMAS
jgi:hypothetical protein